MTRTDKPRRRSPAANTAARATLGAPFRAGTAAVRLASEDTAARFASSTYNPKTRTVIAVLSVGARVPRFGAFEELSIATDAIDLRRVALGQVRLLDSHDRSSVDAILGVVTDAWIEGGKLLGRIQFSETDAGRNAEGMVARGEVTAISVGYRVNVWTRVGIENDVEIWRADEWELLEASLVSVPADADALIRSAQTTLNTHLKGNRMDPEVIDNSNNENTRQIDVRSPQNDGARQVMSDREVREAYDIAERAGIPLDFVRRHVDSGGTMADFRERTFERLADNANRTRTNAARSDETFENPDFLNRSIVDALYSKMTGKAPTGAAVELAGRSMLEMGAMILQSRGERVSWANRVTLADRVLTRSGHTTSDFPNLLTLAGNRVLADAYQIAQTPLKQLARRRTAIDFRPVSILRLSEAPRLDKVPEGGEVKHGSRVEAKEGFAIDTYAKIFGISRQAIINDNLGAFGETSGDFGRAAASTEADLIAGLLLANGGDGANLNDGNPVYSTGRGNKAAAGSAITVDALGAGRKVLRDVTDIDGKTPLNVVPRHLVVGSAKETEAEQVLHEISAVQVDEVNPFPGKLTLHVEPRLIGNSWRLFADPGQLATLVIAYLAGREGPQIDLQQGWDVLGVEFRAVLDFGCAMQDWRGTYLNPGA
ncbi:HK97 family phage prohead protease [Bradyrhizobium sp. CNPSo 4010]|uniref:HK97 family phage prohead protease n=1 Tax=Bradyrhizobium agreste TaxID=2751811 RepID=A0ABS0PUA5_9BRAD|nr:prohead protease/major capsid protein fusion protein [Bradyrhizobium agreste]MBH5400444.1 HK97 family phage prohead protease [Bradyrhizobium agreste]